MVSHLSLLRQGVVQVSSRHLANLPILPGQPASAPHDLLCNYEDGHLYININMDM